ncbi:methyl-accepting chemotaxis protein [Sulfuriferula sp. GW1]|uniref:methyl-accepting chemotaxis protein n=1 Tax=Sulfuriferula sp. GW1 TaxID=3345111 RepID=UPI0039B02462
MKITDLKIGTRLSMGFLLILMLLILVATLSINRFLLMSEHLDRTINNRYPKTIQMHHVKDEVNIIARSMRNTLIMTDEEQVRKEVGRIDHSRKEIADILDKLDKSIDSKQGKELFGKLTEARAQYVSSQDQFMKLIASNQKDEAKALLLGGLRAQQLAYFDALDTQLAYQSDLMNTAGKDAEAAAHSARILVFMLAGLAVLLGGLAAWLITRSITRPINQAVKVAQTVAAGDLTSHIEVTSKDETGQLLQALKDMNNSLSKIVGQVRSGTDTIATASSQIAAGNLDLSSRTEEQASSSLEETASSMEELTSTVKQNADNARQANQLAVTASDIAVKGGNVVAQVVNTMGEINASSKKISDIIGVIDGIAFQTNILALNAAVEAARAGEQGRGFAVVASEVRNLAQRSASAAKEIKILIGDSLETVEGGTKLVDQAGATMNEILESVKRVTDIMGEIAAASQEQTSGIEQINQAVSQMDEVTQQNAALVEQAAAASESLQDQAGNLAQVVSIFKLGEGGQSMSGSRNETPVSHKQVKPKLKGVPARAAAKPKKTATGGGSDEAWEEF